MEIIDINGRKWQKFKGDEGQDVYVALFVQNQDSLLGKFATEESYDIVIDSDADVYLPAESNVDGEVGELNEDRIAFKFRKNTFTPDEQSGAFDGLFDAAVESHNRGLAAGERVEKSGNRDWVTPYQVEVLKYYIDGQPLSLDGSDPLEAIKQKYLGGGNNEARGSVWLRSKVENDYGNYETFFNTVMEELRDAELGEASVMAKKINDGYISQTSYAAALWSGIAGFYGRYPRIPFGRATSFTEHNRSTFEKCYPFARKLEAEFKRLLPVRYGRQQKCAEQMDKRFLIGEDTTFTTITVNTTTKDRNARMACHRDAGSLNEGFSNLTVVTKDGTDWKGGYLCCPEVRMAINARPGDLLLVDNMRIIHGNTPIEAPDSGEDDMLRMSLVFYFREDMLQLGSYDYEVIRRQFVDHRRLNKEHPMWRDRWNGVSPSMWDSDEWYEYLESTGGREMVEKYHPEAYEEKASLEEFF
jgi:hypothetical protein